MDEAKMALALEAYDAVDSTRSVDRVAAAAMVLGLSLSETLSLLYGAGHLRWTAVWNPPGSKERGGGMFERVR